LASAAAIISYSVNDRSVYVCSGLVFRDAYVDRAANAGKMNVGAQLWHGAANGNIRTSSVLRFI
jgi:hypothetical protein